MAQGLTETEGHRGSTGAPGSAVPTPSLSSGVSQQASAEAAPASAPKAPVRVDMSAHVGLRGILSVHIALFHFVFFSPLQWDIQGSSILPFFLMLSGFTMAVVYGGKGPVNEEGTVGCFRTGVNLFGDGGKVQDELHPQGTGKRMDLWPWWQNRIARVVPVYYLSSLPGIPLSALGFGQMWFTPFQAVSTLISNATLSTTLFSFYLGSPLNGPAWTVCTLAVFWLLFPAMLSRAQRMPSAALLSSITFWFWAQCVIGIGLFAAMLLWGAVLPFQVATMHPLSRMPLFWMGVAAGVLRTRASDDGALEWFSSPFTQCSACARCHNQVPQTEVIAGPKAWAEVNWRHSSIIAGVLGACVVLEIADVQMLAALWAQMFLTLNMLIVIVALTMDGGGSVWTRMLRHPWALALGEVSLSLYLVHFPLIDAFALALHGPVERPEGWAIDTCATRVGASSGAAWQACEDSRAAYFKERRLLPVWGIPIVALASAIATIVVYKYVEVPARTACRAKRVKAA